MLCQKCHKNLATVRYAEVVNGKVTDLHLCPQCLAKHKDSGAAGFELSGPVSMARPRPESRRSRAPRLCRTCGTRRARVLDTGYVGCSACYHTFAKEIERMLNDLHGGTRHVGKSPHVDDMRTRLHEDLHTKRAILRSAVSAENYEEAAMLRDEIRQLETVLGHSSSGQG